MNFTDQVGRVIDLNNPAKCIVSLVPSQTELLADLDLNKEVTGITKFCVHPENWLRSKTIIGGTKQLDIEKIKSLNPDLIIANKEENHKDQLEKLMQHFPVWISDVKNLEDAYAMISSIGNLAGKEKEAERIVSKIKLAFQEWVSANRVRKNISAIYLIWRKPMMAAGGDTFINDLMNVFGFQNVMASSSRYPEVSLGAIEKLNPQYILLSSEPYPFNQHHAEEVKRVLPQSIPLLVSGEYFSWYGSRLLKAPSYFSELTQCLPL